MQLKLTIYLAKFQLHFLITMLLIRNECVPIANGKIFTIKLNNYYT